MVIFLESHHFISLLSFSKKQQNYLYAYPINHRSLLLTASLLSIPPLSYSTLLYSRPNHIGKPFDMYLGGGFWQNMVERMDGWVDQGSEESN